MAYWYDQYLAQRLKDHKNIDDAELCVLGEIAALLQREDYRDLKKTAFNKLLATAVRGRMSHDLKNRKWWLKRTGRQSANRESVIKEDAIRLPESKIESVYLENFRAFGSGINSDQAANKGTLVRFVNEKEEILSRVIVFGPNGAGKSSLCEGIELKMTGFIKECDRRNMRLPDFCRRHDCEEQHDVKVKLLPQRSLSQEQQRLAKSCFIEKNRIQDFALLAKRKGDTDIIALLIGLDDLKTIADDIMVLPDSCGIAKQENLLNEAGEALETWKSESRNLDVQIATAQESVESSANSLDELLQTDSGQCCTTIQSSLGSYSDQILSKKNEIEVLNSIGVHSFDRQKFADSIIQSYSVISSYTEVKDNIAEQGANVNYKELYTAISAIKSEDCDACPACDTPLQQVTINPFEKASSELPKLATLQKLQDELEQHKTLAEQGCRTLTAMLNDAAYNRYIVVKWECYTKSSISTVLEQNRRQYQPFIQKFDSLFSNDTVNLLEILLALIRTTLNRTASELDRAVEINNEIQEKKSQLNNELDKLTEGRAELRQLQSAWSEANKRLEQVIISQKDHVIQKEKLENDARIEQSKNQFMQECSNAYQKIHTSFRSFKRDLERKRTSTIQDRIAAYYAMINAGDSDAESVQSVIVQVPENQQDQYSLLLSYVDGSEKNAMHVLSEGHLRSLGLSIMIAVAEKYNLPFLIFDDAVNAIDSDHRGNIINMMFSDEYLQGTQLLVTTHDRLFWERFCFELGRNENESSIPNASFVVAYPENGKGSVFTQYNVDFEAKIEDALTHHDLRQAMIYMRIWIETEVLNYLAKTEGRLSGKLHKSRRYRGNALEPDITSMFDKVRSALTKDDAEGNPLFEQSVRDAWEFLRTDLIDDIVNQDNHAYSEALLNISHAKTSNEVAEILKNAKTVVSALRAKPSPAAQVAMKVKMDVKDKEIKATLKSKSKVPQQVITEQA